MYDLEAQVTGLTAQYGTALAAGNLKAAKTIDNDLKRLGALANGHNNLTGYLEEAYEQHALLKKRVELMRVMRGPDFVLFHRGLRLCRG